MIFDYYLTYLVTKNKIYLDHVKLACKLPEIPVNVFIYRFHSHLICIRIVHITNDGAMYLIFILRTRS